MKSPVMQRVLTVRLDPQRRVPGRVTRRELEAHAVPEIGVGRDDFGEAGRRRSGAIESA